MNLWQANIEKKILSTLYHLWPQHIRNQRCIPHEAHTNTIPYISKLMHKKKHLVFEGLTKMYPALYGECSMCSVIESVHTDMIKIL